MVKLVLQWHPKIYKSHGHLSALTFAKFKACMRLRQDNIALVTPINHLMSPA